MKLDGHPFPQNMVDFSVNMVTAEEKGKVKVLTSARARQDGAVDPERQVTLEQAANPATTAVHEIFRARRHKHGGAHRSLPDAARRMLS
jgi:hypothetical protein